MRHWGAGKMGRKMDCNGMDGWCVVRKRGKGRGRGVG